MVTAIRGVQFKDGKRVWGLILMLGLYEAMDHLAMANSMFWYGHVLRVEDSHVLSRALDFEVEGQKRKGRPKWT